MRTGGDPVEVLDVSPEALVPTEGGLFFALNVPVHLIRFFDFDARSAKVVTEPAGWIMGLSVSPDGRHLVYGQLDHKRADLVQVEGFE